MRTRSFPLIPIITLFLILLSVSLYLFFKSRPTPVSPGANNLIYLEIGDTRLNVEIASTPAARSKGLGGREELAAGWAYPFWMNNMHFPLDIIWIAEDWRILGFEERVLPSSYPTTFRSPRPVLYVLEVNSGFVAESQVTVGETVKLIEVN